MIRTLRRDIAKYNREEGDMEDVLEETGWKLVHGDVFRPPPHPRLFAALIGSGVQLFWMALMTIRILSFPTGIRTQYPHQKFIAYIFCYQMCLAKIFIEKNYNWKLCSKFYMNIVFPFFCQLQMNAIYK